MKKRIDTTAAEQPMRRRSLWMIAFAAAAVAIPLGYTLYTGHIWEDYFITFRFSQNLCEGKGLVYNAGDRVHGFTSPLGVLLPALLYAASGMKDYQAALWGFRFLSIAAFAVGGWLLIERFRKDQMPTACTSLMAGLYLLDVKSVAFTTNGMETGFMLLFVGWGIYLLGDGAETWLWRGACWAGLMWTRPDGCVYIAALSAAQWLFFAGSRRLLLTSMVRSAIVCAISYGPWFVWAWIYYGSPVPNTIAAKSLYLAQSYGEYFHQLVQSVAYFSMNFLMKSSLVYSPIYFGNFADWPVWLGWGSAVMTIVSSFYWLAPHTDRFSRMVSFCFFLLCLYDTCVPVVFPWYLPPLAVVGSVAFSRLTEFAAVVAGRLVPMARRVVYAFAWLAPALLSFEFIETCAQIKVQQKVIEDDCRTQVGLWLREHAKRDELVFLESLGYIGYFSGCRIADFPGLVSKRVVELRRNGVADFYQLMGPLNPTFVVVRGYQERAMAHFPRYELVQTFDVRDELKMHPKIMGQRYLTHDAWYIVYRLRQ